MLYLGWIVAAFLSGAALALAYTVRRQNKVTLRERFDGLGVTQGKSYAAIAAAVKSVPRVTRPCPDGQTLRTWQEGNYTISLLFDSQDFCLGVMEERET